MGALILVSGAAGAEPSATGLSITIDPMWLIGSIVAFITILILIFKAGEWKNDVNRDRSDFKDFMKEIKKNISDIFERLPPVAVASGSPLRLTDLGEKIAERLDAKTIVEGVISEVQAEAEGKGAYQIQELSLKFFLEDYRPSESIETLIQECAFDNGIDREQVLRVLVVVLRDRLLLQTPTDGGDR